MILVGFLILTLTFVATVRFSFFEIVQPWSIFFHHFCLNRLPEQAQAYAELQAIVCGKNFTDASVSEIYTSTGLIHLFVVSGAHLLLIQKILQKIYDPKKNGLLIGLCLLIYALCCNLNPPVTRSLIALAISAITFKNHLYWPENFKIFLGGLVALIFHPAWLTSISLQLSWLAALVVSINSLYLAKKNILLRQSTFFIFLAPVLIFFQTPNPLTIFMNLIFAPVLEFILFPLGLLVWLIPGTYIFFDHTLFAVRAILESFEFQSNKSVIENQSVLVIAGWTLVLTLQFYLHFKELDHRRDHYV